MKPNEFNDLCYRLMDIKAMIEQSREKTTAYLDNNDFEKMNMQLKVTHRLIRMYFNVIKKLNHSL